MNFDILEDHLKWNRFFAWYPVKDIHGKWHWLDIMYYRKIWFTENGFHSVPGVQYGTLLDVLGTM